MSIAEALITAEEFGDMPDDGRYLELVEGRIIEVPPPQYPHGKIRFQAAWLIGQVVRAHDLGSIVINDTGIVTRRNPDSVRGADVAYFSYDRIPRGQEPTSYAEVAPELIFEVRSPSDRWRDIEAKVAEYLNLGALAVCILDPKPREARLYRPGHPNRTLGPDDELTFPEFIALVRDFFQ